MAARYRIRAVWTIWAYLAVTIIIGLSVWVSFHALNEREARVSHTIEVLNEANELTLTMEDSRSGNRGYLVTGQEHFQQESRENAERAAYHLARLRQLTKDNPSQQTKLDRIADAIRRQDSIVNAAALQPQSTTLSTDWREDWEAEQGIEREILDFRNAEENLLRERSQALSGTFNLSLGLTLAAIAFGLVYGIWSLKGASHLLTRQQEYKNELEATNQELSTMNEELAAANEELGSANEELAAATDSQNRLYRDAEQKNAALATANQQLNLALAELKQAQAQLKEQAERELRRERSLLESVIDHSPSGFTIYNKERKAMFVNPAVLKLINRSESDVLGHNPREFLRTEFAETAGSRLDEVFETKSEVKYDLILNQEPESLTHIHVHYVPILNEKEEVEQVLAFVLDVSESRRLEAELEGKSSWLAQVLDSLTDGFVALDPDMRLTYLNYEQERVSNIPRTESIGKTMEELWPEFCRPDNILWREYNRVLRDRVPSRFKLFNPRTKHWLDVSAFPLPDGGMGVLYRNITEQMVLTRELEQTNATLKSVLESMTEAFCLKDKDWRFLTVNKAYEQMSGFRREELIGRSFFEVFSDTEAEGLPGETSLRQVMETGSPNHIAFYYKPKDIWVEADIYPVPSGGLSSFTRNVTQRKQAEEALEASLREKEVLLSEIHHRVKNNLAVISGLIGLQSNSVPDTETQRSLQETRNRIHSMALIHEKLYRSGTLEKINYCDYLTDLAHQIRKSYAQPGLELDLELDCQAIFLDINRALPCGLILNELLANAFEHAFNGRERGKVSIRMALEIPDDHYALRIQDNGVGLSEAALAAAEGRTPANSLGLRLVLGLSKQIRAECSVESEPGKGTAFTLRFRRERQGEG